MTDLAPELFDWLDEHLRPGEAYRIREARAWTRWPHRYRQRVEAGEAASEAGVPALRIVATTPLVRRLADGEAALAMAVAANRVASLSAVVVDEAEATIRLACAATLRPGNRAWLLPVLGEVLKLQIAVPEAGDPSELAEGFGGEPDLEPHPASGRREGAHPEMAVVDAYQRAGVEPARIPAATFRAAVGDLHRMDIPATADGTLLEVGADTFNLGGAAKITVENAAHPGFGNGLLAVLRVPPSAAAQHAARAANELNRRELRERLDGHSLGAWSHDDAGLGHLVFYPNRLIPVGEAERRARVINCVLDEARRLAWLDRTWPTLAGGPAGDEARPAALDVRRAAAAP